MPAKTTAAVRLERAKRGLIAGRWIIVLMLDEVFALAVATRETFDSEEAARAECVRQGWAIVGVER